MAKNDGDFEAFSVTCDGTEIFTTAQAARFLNTSQEQIRQWSAAGALCPGRSGKHAVYTRRDLERCKRTEREQTITRKLVEGMHPIDIYLEKSAVYSLREINAAMLQWARLAGVWIVEGPRGSYARWLERFGLTRCRPRELRRLVEALLRDPELGERARMLLSDMRKVRAA